MKAVWLAILVLALPCGQAFAWGQAGHSIVGELAEHRLDQPTLNADSALPPLDDWRFEVSKVARDERMLADETWQVRIGDDKWVQYVERPTPGGDHVIFGHDVSARRSASWRRACLRESKRRRNCVGSSPTPTATRPSFD